MIAEIKQYFAKERNEEMGDLASEMVLDFIVGKLAPEFYNQGVDNAYRHMKEAPRKICWGYGREGEGGFVRIR